MELLEIKTRKVSRVWYLLPILFGLIGGFLGILGGVAGVFGGVIAYFLIKDKDKKFAESCLIVGILATILGIFLRILLFMYI